MRPNAFGTLALATLLLSGCMTVASVAPDQLLRVAGLSPSSQAEIQTADGKRTVDGNATVRLRTREGVAYDVPLAKLKHDDGALLLPPNDVPLDVGQVSSATLFVAEPARTQRIALAITGSVLGTAVTVGAVALIVLLTSAQQVHPEGVNAFP